MPESPSTTRTLLVPSSSLLATLPITSRLSSRSTNTAATAPPNLADFTMHHVNNARDQGI
ncbi:hypothetical protein AQJ67_35710 [Streptomyces caeruleatus]|uniref:Uncharacterized protein n=1 Tax=Streptomyces caeruleatus TaxID=661399 RepID=A0A101TN49_9ACTN|nr:hypothetical protein AQJ67_35710 [Streptomyces caeruleatus]